MEIADVVDAIICAETRPASEEGGGTFSDTPALPWSDAARAAAVRLVEAQLSTLAADLAAFARHGKRTTVNADDVRLALRRCPGLAERISRRVADEVAAAPRKRPTKAAD